MHIAHVRNVVVFKITTTSTKLTTIRHERLAVCTLCANFVFIALTEQANVFTFIQYTQHSMLNRFIETTVSSEPLFLFLFFLPTFYFMDFFSRTVVFLFVVFIHPFRSDRRWFGRLKCMSVSFVSMCVCLCSFWCVFYVCKRACMWWECTTHINNAPWLSNHACARALCYRTCQIKFQQIYFNYRK